MRRLVGAEPRWAKAEATNPSKLPPTPSDALITKSDCGIEYLQSNLMSREATYPHFDHEQPEN